MLSAAATYAPKGIRVNCVAPGLTRTPLAERITSNAAVSLTAAPALVAAARRSSNLTSSSCQGQDAMRGSLSTRATTLPVGESFEPCVFHDSMHAAPQALKASEAMHALKRVGEADEVAAALEFLLLPSNRWGAHAVQRGVCGSG